MISFFYSTAVGLRSRKVGFRQVLNSGLDLIFTGDDCWLIQEKDGQQPSKHKGLS